MSDSIFSATEPTLGYLYQIQYGLLLLFTSKQEDNAKILIESLDDIEIKIDDKTKLYQSKYHLKSKTNLSDRSSDFWKTMRVWCEQIENGDIDIEKTIFTLITTEKISTNSIIYDIKNKNDIDNILQNLNNIADETSNNENRKGYVAFKALTSSQQKQLIEKIYVIDSSLDFKDINRKILNELKLSTEPSKIQALFERVIGWFLYNSILHLLREKDFISFEELSQQINLITDTFKSDNLPIDFPEKIALDGEELQKIQSFKFVQQLELIDSSPRMTNTAISDYQRSFKQRSKWLKDNLLSPQEEIDFDKKLVDDWERKFNLLLDKYENIPVDQKANKGNEFYKKFYIENIPNIYIRERFRESYLTLGSCHMLSDKLQIGWHPDFEEFLKASNDS